MTLPAHKREFLALAIEAGVLRFGTFTLKSGRESPYFFNLGQISSGPALARLGTCYARAWVESGIAADVLFGPAYKGIPIAVAMAVQAAGLGREVAVAYNRKEAKAHGEGGRLVGAPVTGRVLVVDDVLTAGTAVRESMALLAEADAVPVGLLVAFDRAERGAGGRSALQEIRDEFRMPAVAIATLADLIEYQEETGGETEALRRHRDRFGAG